MNASRVHSEFKAELSLRAARFFEKKGCAVQRSRPFVLAEPSRWPANILLDEVVEFVDRERRRRPLRLSSQLHSGLSSQALLLNLVGPLVVGNDIEPLQGTLAAKGIAWDGDLARAQLAPEDCLAADEGAGQPLPADLLVAGCQAPDLIVAARLAERAFDGCPFFARNQCGGENPTASFLLCPRHLGGWNGWNLLQEWGLPGPTWLEKAVCPLARGHQFFLAALLARQRNGLLLLLHDQRNPFFCDSQSRSLIADLTSMLPLVLQNSVVAVGMQDLFQAIAVSGRHDEWTGDFAEKYGLLPSAGPAAVVQPTSTRQPCSP